MTCAIDSMQNLILVPGLGTGTLYGLGCGQRYVHQTVSINVSVGTSSNHVDMKSTVNTTIEGVDAALHPDP